LLQLFFYFSPLPQFLSKYLETNSSTSFLLISEDKLAPVEQETVQRQTQTQRESSKIFPLLFVSSSSMEQADGTII
jgi:hypothetical protein